MQKTVDKVAEYVTQLLDEKLADGHYFHSLKHTREMVEAALEIADNTDLTKKELEILMIAAWFHDAGYTVTYENHEEKSAEIAEEYLKQLNYPDKSIEAVKQLILKTKIDSQPSTELEKILRDADLSHLAKKSGLKRGKLLRKELEEVCNKTFTDFEWLQFDKTFYSKMYYFTEYAKKNWQPHISRNLKKLEKRIEEIGEEKMQENKNPDKALSDKELKKLSKQKIPDRGVETVFRTTSRNHLTLSSMADSKANTLISISALIISIILSFLVKNLDVQAFLTIPTSILLIVCVITIIFATMSTRPKVTKLGLSREDIKERRGNLLFFGNFYQMSVEDYEWGMQELMNDRDYLYSNLTKDIYFLGLVLAKKYKFLSIAYNVFMYGIIISVLSFIVVINF